MGEVEYARYTYELPASSTALARLKAEWSRCRRAWNECVAMPSKAHRPRDKLRLLSGRVTPPTEVMRAQRGGGRQASSHQVLAAIIFVATSGCTSRQLPPAFRPSRQTVHRRFAQWRRARVRATLHRVIFDVLGARGELDRSRCAIASVRLRAAKEAIDRTEPERPRKPESKAHLTTDRKGISLAPGASDADMHDSQGHQPLVRGISLTSPCRVRRRAVGGRPPLHRAAVSALKCTSGQPRNAFAPGGNRRDFCTEPGEPTCRKPGEVSQESPLSGEGGVSRATQPSCSFSHRRTSGVTGSVMSANSSCRLRNLAT